MTRRVVGFYTDKRRRVRPITARRGLLRIRKSRTIFFPPTYEKYARIVRVDTPANARESVEKLEAKFRAARTEEKKVAYQARHRACSHTSPCHVSK
jgi:hypothetical protein